MSFKNKVNISVLISLLSIILLLFVLGVYAQDNSTVITNGTDINTTSVNNTNDSIREVNVHNYMELKTAVDNLTAHPCEKLVINLEDGDYKINTDPIQVKKGQNVVINGNGHTIDCNYKHFMDICNGGNVTINNLQVQTAKLMVDGGAIYNTGTLTVTSSTFNDNNAGISGGAIYNKGGTLTVTSSTFNNNKADCYGGAIYNVQGTLTVTGSTFNNNQAYNHNGGAIYNVQGTLTVTSSTFNNNKADEDGGAIYSNGGKVNPIQDCTFKNNIANSDEPGRCEGGAIKCTGNNDPLIVTNCQFTGNRAESGGAIDARVLQIRNCAFIQNKASNSVLACDGGAVNCNDLNECTGCNFTGNTAVDNGGAIYNKGGTVTVHDSTFNNNQAKKNGGAIKCTGNNNPLIVTDCQFTGNNAQDGGAIDCRVLQIRNCAFIQNKASTSDLSCDGGAVNCNDLNECHDCNFTGNTADNGGAIAIMEKAGKNNIKDCIFKDNKATALKGGVNGKGGAIFVNRQAAHISLVHNQFINNYATNKGDNVYNWGHYDKIEHNYFPKEEQNKFREHGFIRDTNYNDKIPFYNLEDYYKWKG